MSSHLQHISNLALLCLQHGVKEAVITPGSRNAPLISAFTQQPGIRCYSIPDERSAAYFGLGLSLASQTPVVILCTSGTAALNFSPAVAEAWYQHVPLIVITADRPPDAIDKLHNQTIPQNGIYTQFVKGSLCWDKSLSDRVAAKKANALLELSAAPYRGPVHFNVPVEEPLYALLPEAKPLFALPKSVSLSGAPAISLSALWRKSMKIIVLCGQYPYNSALNAAITLLVKKQKAVVIAEPLANIRVKQVIHAPENVLLSLVGRNDSCYRPDLLVSLGGQVVSKQWQRWMEMQPELQHWRITETAQMPDTYGNLKGISIGNPGAILQQLATTENQPSPVFFSDWLHIAHTRQKVVRDFAREAPFSDLKVMSQIISSLPGGCNLHLGNSSVVRYAQLFDLTGTLHVFGNRGVSGIDGSVSTAAAIATATPHIPNVLIVGDMGFVYDSNGLWNKHFPDNLTIFVINNAGGGIFRLIDGPEKMPWFETFQETRHAVNLEALSHAYHLNFQRCDNLGALQRLLKTLFQSKQRATVIEIQTDRYMNPEIYKKYKNKLVETYEYAQRVDYPKKV